MSHRFTDTKGRSWDLTLTVGAVRRIKSELDVDLMDAFDVRVLAKLTNDLELFVNTLWVVCEPQAKAVRRRWWWPFTEKVSDVEFGMSLGGSAFDHATDAFMEALTDFFPQRRRAALQAVMRRVRDVEDRAMGMAIEKVCGKLADERIEAEMRKASDEADAILRSSGNGSGRLPAH